MGCFYKFNGFKHLVLSSILCTFTLEVVSPLPVYGQIHEGINDVTFGVKIQKLIGKAYDYYNALDSNNLLNAILEIKSEIESYTGNKIDISKEIDKIENSLKKKGLKINKKMFKNYKNLLIKKDKKMHAQALCMETYFLDQPNMSFQDYEELYFAAVNKNQYQENEAAELPLKFVVSISLMLGGSFVMFASPVCPILAYAGEMMVATGFGMLVDQCLDKYKKNFMTYCDQTAKPVICKIADTRFADM